MAKRKDAGDTISNVVAMESERTEANLRLGEWLRMLAAHADAGRVEAWLFTCHVEGVSTRSFGPTLCDAALLTLQAQGQILEATKA